MALTADRNTPHKDAVLVGFPVGAGVKIFAGSLVAANASGFVVPGATSASLTYLGRAEEFIDNTAGTDAAKTVLVRRGKAFKFSNSSVDPVVQADLLKNCYIVDDQTVAHSSETGTRSVAGKVLGLEADGVWIE